MLYIMLHTWIWGTNVLGGMCPPCQKEYMNAVHLRSLSTTPCLKLICFSLLAAAWTLVSPAYQIFIWLLQTNIATQVFPCSNHPLTSKYIMITELTLDVNTYFYVKPY